MDMSACLQVAFLPGQRLEVLMYLVMFDVGV